MSKNSYNLGKWPGSYSKPKKKREYNIAKKFKSLEEGNCIVIDEYELTFKKNEFSVHFNDNNSKFLVAIFPVLIGSEESLLEHVLNQMKKKSL